MTFTDSVNAALHPLYDRFDEATGNTR